MDELAEEIGVKPDFRRLFRQDPFLAMRCYFGPCVPAQYRLMGANSWSGAKTAIRDTFSNTMAPLKRRAVPRPECTTPMITVNDEKTVGYAIVPTFKYFIYCVLMLWAVWALCKIITTMKYL